jgi:hypothetical protein
MILYPGHLEPQLVISDESDESTDPVGEMFRSDRAKAKQAACTLLAYNRGLIPDLQRYTRAIFTFLSKDLDLDAPGSDQDDGSGEDGSEDSYEP